MVVLHMDQIFVLDVHVRSDNVQWMIESTILKSITYEMEKLRT